jgi:hypothetical protein
MRTHDFKRDLAAAEKQDIAAMCRLDTLFHSLKVAKATTEEDKAGTDFWLTFAGGRLSVDLKLRGVDPVVDFGRDDLVLETWSVYETRKPGWTRDPAKLTDVVVWWWRPTDRIAILPYRILRDVFNEHWKEWAWKYDEMIQPNRGYTSRAVFVPSPLVLSAVEQHPGYWDEMARLAQIIG